MSWLWICVAVVAGILIGGALAIWLLNKALENAIGGFFGW